LLKVTAPEFRHDAHHWLILHGRYTCMARRPRCGQCPIADLCEWPDKAAAVAVTGAAAGVDKPRAA
jgi:endonuclease-3